MTCKNMAIQNSEKADYLQICGSNINIYSKNKGLCLGAGILTIGGWGGGGGWGEESQTFFVIYLGGSRFFSSGIGWGFLLFFTSHENVTGAPTW